MEVIGNSSTTDQMYSIPQVLEKIMGM